MIKFDYEKESDILEIKFSEAPIKESEYIKDTGIIVDYDEDGNIAGIEITSFSKRTKKEVLLNYIWILTLILILFSIKNNDWKGTF